MLTSNEQATIEFLNEVFQSAHLINKSDKPVIIVAENDKKARQLDFYLEQFLSHDTQPGCYFPGWETLPYEMELPAPALTAIRNKIQHQFYTQQLSYVVLSCQTLLTRLPPRSFVMQNNYLFKVGQAIDLENFKTQLRLWGYYRDEETENPGTFAIRGSIIDLFPANSKTAIRIELFDDVIETIRKKTTNTQMQSEKLEEIAYYSSHEMNLDEPTIKYFNAAWQAYFGSKSNDTALVKKINNKIYAPGYHNFLGFFHEHMTSWIEMGQDAIWLMQGNVHNNSQVFLAKAEEHYREKFHQNLSILPPDLIYMAWDQIAKQPARPLKDDQQVIKPLGSQQRLSTLNWLNKPTTKNLKNKFIIALPTHAHLNLLNAALTQLPKLSSGDLLEHLQVKRHSEQAYLYFNHFEMSFEYRDFIVIGNDLLLHDRGAFKISAPIIQESDSENLVDCVFAPGDVVTHKRYGIAKLTHLGPMSDHGDQNEFCTLEFLDGDKIYLPITQLSQLSPIHQHGQCLELSKLGSKKWQRSQLNAVKKMSDNAAYLLGLYSNRAKTKRTPFALNNIEWQDFLDAFTFTDTADQTKITQQLVLDLCQREHPMDRLICGDVGFGKTELAMRAAWIVAHAGFQVVFMAPTSILAQQHFNRLSARFDASAIKLTKLTGSVMSNKTALAAIKSGAADIVVGTHNLLSKSIIFRNLALMIIDEEQKFGVRQKEKLKEFYPHVDLLSLSATPIPRTLNMTMAAIRDISLLSSPPSNRMDVKTSVHNLNDKEIMKQAIAREINRGGQVYFCYNKIENLDEMKQTLLHWFPNLEVAIAHGQMDKKQLTLIMDQFYYNQVDLLLCSSIIDSGLDHSNANTIIVYRADLFGLSQLHQLRGRIGRSCHQGYAYFFIPSEEYVSSKAKNRMAALKQHQKIGSGFSLAIEDLEIRGAGNLLGNNQSGHIDQLGLIHFTELMEQTIKWLQENPNETINPEQIIADQSFTFDYPGDALITKEYLLDPKLRLSWYSKISRAKSANTLLKIISELHTKYGPIPQQVLNLIELAHLRILLEKIGVRKVSISANKTTLYFNEQALSSKNNLVNIALTHPQFFKLSPPNMIVVWQNGALTNLNYFDEIKTKCAHLTNSTQKD